VTGAFVIVYSRQSVLAAGIVVLVLVAIPVAMMNTAMTPLLLRAASPQHLGRVIAVFNPVNQLASMLSVVVAGWLASTALRGFSGHLDPCCPAGWGRCPGRVRGPGGWPGAGSRCPA
jgi:uncharacterized membrane protein